MDKKTYLETVKDLKTISTVTHAGVCRSLFWGSILGALSVSHRERNNAERSDYVQHKIDASQYWMLELLGPNASKEQINALLTDVVVFWVTPQTQNREILEQIPESFKADVLKMPQEEAASKKEFLDSDKGKELIAELRKFTDAEPAEFANLTEASTAFQTLHSKVFDQGVKSSASASNKRGQFALDALSTAKMLEEVCENIYEMVKEAEAKVA